MKRTNVPKQALAARIVPRCKRSHTAKANSHKSTANAASTASCGASTFCFSIRNANANGPKSVPVGEPCPVRIFVANANKKTPASITRASIASVRIVLIERPGIISSPPWYHFRRSTRNAETAQITTAKPRMTGTEMPNKPSLPPPAVTSL